MVDQSATYQLPDDAKLQVTNGYAPQFGQLSRLLSYVAGRPDTSRVYYDDIVEGTGLSNVHVKNMCSIAIAMDLLAPRVLRLTEIGLLITQHDPFFDDLGSLWWCHYVISANPRHIVWNRLTNSILPTARGFVRITPKKYFVDLAERFSEKTIENHIENEIWRTIAAYTTHRLRRLDYLLESEDGYCLSENPAAVPPLVLLATIVAYRDVLHPKATGLEIPLICDGDNSPGRILHLSEWRVREMLEGLRRAGLLEIESRANLDQIRFTDQFTPRDLLARYYEERV